MLYEKINIDVIGAGYNGTTHIGHWDE